MNIEHIEIRRILAGRPLPEEIIFGYRFSKYLTASIDNLRKYVKKYKLIYVGCMDYLEYLLLTEDSKLYRLEDELTEDLEEPQFLKPLFYSITRKAITKEEIEESWTINNESILKSIDYTPMITNYFHIKDEDFLKMASNLIDQRGMSIWDTFIKCIFVVDESRYNYIYVWELLKERYPSFSDLLVKK